MWLDDREAQGVQEPQLLVLKAEMGGRIGGDWTLV